MFSFMARKNQVKASALIRRLCDRTTASVVVPTDLRTTTRYQRHIPFAACAVLDGRADAEHWYFGTSCDFSDHGMGLISEDVPASDELLVGFVSVDDPTDVWFFRALRRHSTAIGGGFRQTGLELLEFMNDDHRKLLATLQPGVQRLTGIA